MTRHTHRYGMHFSAEAVGSFEHLVQFGERSRDKVSLDDFSVRDLAAEQREAQKQAKLRAAIEREREAAAERKAEREMNAAMAFHIERELRDRGVRTISSDDIVKIMPEVRAAASKIHYGSQIEIMATIVQEKLAPKQSLATTPSCPLPSIPGYGGEYRRVILACSGYTSQSIGFSQTGCEIGYYDTSGDSVLYSRRGVHARRCRRCRHRLAVYECKEGLQFILCGRQWGYQRTRRYAALWRTLWYCCYNHG